MRGEERRTRCTIEGERRGQAPSRRTDLYCECMQLFCITPSRVCDVRGVRIPGPTLKPSERQ